MGMPNVGISRSRALTPPAGDQAIADEAGVSREMVQKTRATQVGILPTSTQPSKILTKTDSLVQKRMGIDGKQYPVRSKPQEASRSVPQRHKATQTERVEAVEKPEKHICPHCKGTGYIE